MLNFILGQIIVEFFQFPFDILQDSSDHSNYGNHQRSKGHCPKVENCGVPDGSPDSTVGKIFFLVESPVPLGEYSCQHQLSEGTEEKHSPGIKIDKVLNIDVSWLLLPVEPKQVAEGVERVVFVLGIFDELTDDSRTHSGAVESLELFRNTGGVGGGVDDLAAVPTVAAHIGLGLLSGGNSVLLLSSAR